MQNPSPAPEGLKPVLCLSGQWGEDTGELATPLAVGLPGLSLHPDGAGLKGGVNEVMFFLCDKGDIIALEFQGLWKGEGWGGMMEHVITV